MAFGKKENNYWYRQSLGWVGKSINLCYGNIKDAYRAASFTTTKTIRVFQTIGNG